VGGYSIPDAVRFLNQNGLACYQDPNRASRALAGLVQYRQLKERKNLTPDKVIDVDRNLVKTLLTSAWEEKGAGFINPAIAVQIVSAYGIPVPDSGVASSLKQALILAEKIQYPVALKLVAKGVIHKMDVGGLALDLGNADQLQKAYQRIVGENPANRAMIQSMVSAGEETIVGIQRDSQFGPILMFGAGGTYVEVNQDVIFRLAPLCRHDALDMVGETVIGRILGGIRGRKPRDTDNLVDVLVRIGQLAHDFPAIAELDINPLIVNEKGKGCSAVDVRIAIDQSP
jgi:acetyltransferase